MSSAMLGVDRLVVDIESSRILRAVTLQVAAGEARPGPTSILAATPGRRSRSVAIGKRSTPDRGQILGMPSLF